MTQRESPAPVGVSGDIAGRRRRLRSGRSEDRLRVARALFPEPGTKWWLPFALMMGLSIVIAVMGLSADSSAVVIGAMLVAPLMTPVVAVAAGMAMAMPRHLARALGAVAGASVGGVALAWALARVLPHSDRILTHEVLARTSPDLRDLLVALAAGAAGAYATTRDQVSAALPGVAVAVALVPPLATAGFTLATGREDLAKGACSCTAQTSSPLFCRASSCCS